MKSSVIEPSLMERLSAYVIPGSPERVALSDGRHQLSYRQLIAQVQAQRLVLERLGAKVVALRGANSVAWVVADLACQAAGLVCIPVPDFFSEQQVRHCLQSADVVLSDDDGLGALLTTMGYESVALAGLDDSFAGNSLRVWQLSSACSVAPKSELARPDGTQKITFTSGSTGSPKGVCLSQQLQWQVAQSLGAVIAVDEPRHLCLLPLATLLENVAGIYAPLLRGGTVLLPSADRRGLCGSSGLDLARMVACISEHGPQTLIVLPQLLVALVAACQQGWQPPISLKFVAVGGGKVAPQLLRQARSYGLPVFEGYGLSECASVVALNTPADDGHGSVGRVLPHCRVTIDGGEVIVKGACHLGYMGQPSSWYGESVHTGDLGSLNEDWLSISGRKKNLLISSFGRNVNPEWVESELLASPILSQCVVLGEARPYLVALLSASDSVTDGAIAQWVTQVNAELPDYARVQCWQRLKPDQWQGLLTANGRVQRALIIANYSDAIDSLYPRSSDIQSCADTHSYSSSTNPTTDILDEGIYQ